MCGLPTVTGSPFCVYGATRWGWPAQATPPIITRTRSRSVAAISPVYGSAVVPPTAIRSARLPASSVPIAPSQPSICAAVDVAIATSSRSVKIGPCAAFAL